MDTVCEGCFQNHYLFTAAASPKLLTFTAFKPTAVFDDEKTLDRERKNMK